MASAVFQRFDRLHEIHGVIQKQVNKTGYFEISGWGMLPWNQKDRNKL